MSKAQLAWLAGALEKAKSKTHTFVFVHHPRWRKDYYLGNNWDEVHALFKKAGNVRAVFAGHMHRRRYEGKRDGIVYYTLATTGGGIPFNKAGTGHVHHLDVVTVRKDRFSIATIPVGQVLDPKEMTPERHKQIDALRRMVATRVGAAPRIRPDGTADGMVKIEVRNPLDRPVQITGRLASGDQRWWSWPDHVHVTLKPKERRMIPMRYLRRDKNSLDTLGELEFRFEVACSFETMRVAIPERRVALGLGLAAIPQSWDEPAPNQALQITGKAGAVGTPLRVPDGPFTIEGWIRATDYSGRRGFLSKAEMSEYCIFVSNGTPSFSVFLGDKYVTAEPHEPMLEPNRWYHIAGVFDGQELRLYVDGNLLASTPGKGKRKRNGFPFLAGADVNRNGRPTSPITGRIDEVRISIGARYKAPFTPQLRPEADETTLLLYRFDRSLGPFHPDASKHGRHGLRHGRVKLVPAQSLPSSDH